MFVGNNIMELYYSMRVVCKSVHMRVMRRKSCTLYKINCSLQFYKIIIDIMEKYLYLSSQCIII